MERISAMERLKEEFITENELADFLGVDTKRVRDLRSMHLNGKILFIDHIKPTSKCVLYRYEDVIKYLESLQGTNSFGSAKDEAGIE